MKDSIGINTIIHKGVVKKSDDESVTVIITPASACSGCHAEGSCNLSGKVEKSVIVKGRYEVNEGDDVTVSIKQSTGFTALFLGYVLPLIIIITALVILQALKYPELIAGLVSISSLLPYYLILYLFRKRINEKFIFSIKV